MNPVGWSMKKYADLLRQGKTVQFRAYGNSMDPIVKNGELVTVSPKLTYLSVGTTVLCKVKGCYYLHLIWRIYTDDGSCTMYLIGNNKNHANGWIIKDDIYGRLISVEP